MFKIIYEHTDYQSFIEQLQAQVGGILEGNRFTFQEDVGQGFYEAIHLPNGLQMVAFNYKIYQEVYFERNARKEKFFILRFDDMLIPADVTISLAEDQAKMKTIRNVLLTNTCTHLSSLLPKGTAASGISIMFSQEWLQNYFQSNGLDDSIEKYLGMRISALNFEPLDEEYRKIIKEIIATENSETLRLLVIQNRVMLLIERFFTRLHKKVAEVKQVHNINEDEVQRLSVIEEILKNTSSELPPGIEELAKKASMSTSKLKKSFKIIYGIPPYQYFQKFRMERAKDLLLTGKYSVKEVGLEVGYTNLSNFAKAFKSTFNQLPSDLL
jgi:AraC-like DNA-binding protein